MTGLWSWIRARRATRRGRLRVELHDITDRLAVAEQQNLRFVTAITATARALEARDLDDAQTLLHDALLDRKQAEGR